MSFVTKFFRNSQKQVFRPDEVAELFHVHVSSVRRWCAEGWLACEVTMGGHRRITREAILIRLAGASMNAQ